MVESSTRHFAGASASSLSCGPFKGEKFLVGLCARWRGTGPDVLNDLPTSVWLALEDDYVAAFGGDFSAGGDGG